VRSSEGMTIGALAVTGAPAAASAAAEEERALVRRAATDPEAFAEVYRRYAPRVFAYLRSRTDADGAADLTQQVFVRALSAIGRYKERDAPFRAWIFRIAANAAIDRHRRDRHLLPLAAAEGVVASTPDPELSAIHADQLRRLGALIGDLKESDQQLLALRFGGGLTSGEIAHVVSRSEDAVRKQLWRVIRALKERSQP
jgi:RNA polymerase sigma-70 factor (ECF subfamily)